MAKRISKARKDAQKIMQMPSTSEEERAIDELFKDSKLKRIQTLFEVMQDAKGQARLQAEARIAELEREREHSGAVEVEWDWDVIATNEAFTA